MNKKTELKPILTFNNESDYTEFFNSNKRTCEYLSDYYIDSIKQNILNKLKALPPRKQEELDISGYKEFNDPQYQELIDKLKAHKSWYFSSLSSLSSIEDKENYTAKLLNTFEYMYEHISRGIFVSIRDQKIHELIIFANPNYVNNWSKNLKFENNQTQEEYYESKRKHYRKEQIIPMKNWYAGGFLLDNELPFKYENGKRKTLLWTNHSLIPILDMLKTLLNCRKVKDCDFFINKRDHPVLRKSLEEPYRNLHPDPLPQIPAKYLNADGSNNFLPILSFYGSDTFADILCPCAEDWLIACGTIFMQGDEKPASGFADVNYMKYEHIQWEDKQPIAVFRGRGTGGSNLKNNQRFQLAKFADELNDKTVLDVGIITYNTRDKVNYTPRLTITYPKPDELPFKLGEFMSMNQQMHYKYHLNVQGHAAINRTSYMYKSKSLVMVLEPQFNEVSGQWFSSLFKENVDYVQVKKDFSDIVDKIQWCRDHDDECKNMMLSAYDKQRKYLSKSGIMDYMQLLINVVY